MFVRLLNLLPPTVIEYVSRFIALVIGAMLFPAKALAKSALTPFADLDALMSVDSMYQETLSLLFKLHEHRDILTTTLIPKLILCIILMVLFLYICNRLGLAISRDLMRYYRLQQAGT